MNKRLECKIFGRVRFVLFRDFVCRNARKMKLVGVVKNIDDGSVYIVAEGEEIKLQNFLEIISKGSMLSKVSKIENEWKEAVNNFSDFSIQYYDR